MKLENVFSYIWENFKGSALKENEKRQLMEIKWLIFPLVCDSDTSLEVGTEHL